MKIDGTSSIQQIGALRSPTRETQVATRSTESDRVQLSDTATWLSHLQTELENTPAVRPDVVAQARADIASGAIESEEVLNTAVDAILAGF